MKAPLHLHSTPQQHILTKSEEEARRLGYEKVGTEHILLSIIKEGDCAASRLLNTMSVNLQKLFTLPVANACKPSTRFPIPQDVEICFL